MPATKDFSELDEREILALAISLEEEDSLIYGEFAEGLREAYPDTARLFEAMADEESGHRHRLLDLFRAKFGEHVPLIRRQDVRGFVRRQPVWLARPLRLEKVREQAELMEAETLRFYTRAAQRSQDASIRQLLGDLAAEERRHEARAGALQDRYVTPDVARTEGEAQKRLHLLQVVQPGLAGLMDGSVSTLAPLFAAAFATHNTWETFQVGMAAAVGAGISMGFAEALSDDGSLTGRGSPWLRGTVSGTMTMLGGVGHALPYLIADFRTATILAVAVVMMELAAIVWIQNRFMDTPLVPAAVKVVIGGLLVFAAGILIGTA